MNNKIILWLDDVRDPMTSEFLPKFIPNFKTYDIIIWVKTYDEFCEWIKTNGLPTNPDLLKISFDHDLAHEHYTPEHRYDDYHTWVSEQEFQEKTGMDCAKWLIDYCLDYKKTLPTWVVHSANPSGAENITKVLLNFIKFQNK